jgi:hypothetical protein
MDITVAPDSVCMVNNMPADDDTKVYENFTVSWEVTDGTFDTSAYVATNYVEEVIETDDDKEEKVAEVKAKTVNISVSVNNKPVELKGKSKYVFVDVFDEIDFDRTKAKGTLITRINGHDAEYMEELHGGEMIEIYWDKDRRS